MAKEFVGNFYSSATWRKCRASFIQERIAIDGGVCTVCGKEPGYIVHHKIKITKENFSDPNITLSHDNLDYMCIACHNTHHWMEEQGIEYRFTPDGQPVPTAPIKNIDIGN